MDRSTTHGNLRPELYPPLEPFDRRMLDVGDGHRIYVEQCGNPQGRPAIVLHGGPGGGCSPMMRRYFDPQHWRIVLFDQRGCGHSRPHAAVMANTTQALIGDIERIRETLAIHDFLLFGGSWGATLALLYAQAHPQRARALVLRGVFLMTEAELDWFYGGGAGRFWPELWERFVAPIPEVERGDVIGAYHRRLFSEGGTEVLRLARCWAGWENALASIDSDGRAGEIPDDYALAFARLEAHYFHHRGFLARDGQILAEVDRIAQVPGAIVQGRYDMICPPASAWALHRAWPASQLTLVGRAGHALSEPPITRELIRAVRRFESH